MDIKIPKTLECCGRKPYRTFYQTGFKDEDGSFVLQCKNFCGNRVSVDNNWKGEHIVKIETIKKWNELVKVKE